MLSAWHHLPETSQYAILQNITRLRSLKDTMKRIYSLYLTIAIASISPACNTLCQEERQGHEAETPQKPEHQTPEKHSSQQQQQSYQQHKQTPLERIPSRKQPSVDTSLRFMKIAYMSLDQTYQAYQLYLEERNIDAAIHALERILILEERQDMLEVYTLDLGDLQHYKQDYKNAHTIYNTFIDRYPGSRYLEYAYYAALCCHYQEVLEPNRDQTETNNMISAAQAYLQTFGQHGTYAQEARQLAYYGYQILCCAELDICDFYLNKYTYTTSLSCLRSVYQRLSYIAHEIVPRLPQEQHDAAHTCISRVQEQVSLDQHDATTEAYNQAAYEHLCQAVERLHHICDVTVRTRPWWYPFR